MDRSIKNRIIAGLFFLALTILLTSSAYNESFRYETRGKRDPFVPLIGSGKVVSAELEDILSIEDVHLEGMATATKGNKIVMINGQMLKENEKVGNLVIKHIGNKVVMILLDGKEYKLSLSEEGGPKGEK